MDNFYDNFPDLYKILGIDKDSSSKDITTAYRSLALMYHPDKCPDKSKLFEKITQAYSILINPQEKDEYDACPIHVLQKFLKLLVIDIILIIMQTIYR